MSKLLDIIICTYNRENLLLDCISSLRLQDHPVHDWNIIVVNNGSGEFCANTQTKLSEIQNLKVLHQPEPGLSKARNTAIEMSQSDWVAFLDDDAKVPVDYVGRILDNTVSHDFACFGGHIRSWWLYGRPRWLSEDFGSKPKLKNETGVIEKGYNWGSNIIIKRSVLAEIGNFPTYIGMKGQQLGYAAENIVQMKLREEGYNIGYDPDLYIEHVVMAQKLKLVWHLKSAYATGRDGRSIYPNQYGIIGMFQSLKNCFSRPLKTIWFLITKKEHYWEHALLESGRAWFLFWGKVSSHF